MEKMYKGDLYGINLHTNGNTVASAYVCEGEVVVLEGRRLIKTGSLLTEDFRGWRKTREDAEADIAAEMRDVAEKLLVEADRREGVPA